MSRSASRRLALLTAVVALIAPASVAARQTTPEPTDQELMHRVDSLAPLIKEAISEARAEQIERDRRVEREVPTRTLLFGSLRVMVFPGDEELARDVVGGVWEREYAAWMDGSPAVDARRMFFQWRMHPRPFNTSVLERVGKVQGEWQGRAYMEQGVRNTVGTWLHEDLIGTALATWVSEAVRPPGDGARLLRELTHAPSQAAQSCLAGDLDACLLATGIQVDDYPIDDWYNASERRFLVWSQRDALLQMGRARLERCLSGDDATCDGLLRQYDQRRYREWIEPLHGDVRNSVLWIALQEGGHGAWGRLLAAADQGPRAALEAASGMDARALVAEWRTWLLAQRPVQRAGMGSMMLGALFWILVSTLLATRSSRWRFG